MKPKCNAGAIILAGGKSIRMGTDKAFLKIGQKTIIRHILDELQKELQDILIVSKKETCFEEMGVRIVTDIYPGNSPLVGIHAGLVYALNYYNLVIACDLPFINGKLVKLMVEQAQGADVLVPQKGKYLQPLCAVYSKKCLGPIEESLSAGRLKVTAFYPKVKVKYIDEDKLSGLAGRDNLFFNINTPEDLTLAREIALIDRLK